ncbi:MAG TPA: winged helix-turn-helix domain-containing protein [Phycisphaerae bacterium]|nr:winged helix-turn-helix domain-containing protein [Phycisphaerae bacterium]
MKAKKTKKGAKKQQAPKKRVVTKAQYEAEAKAAKGAAPTSKAKPKAPAKERKPRAGKPSGLDAAAKVLAEAGEPLNTKTMVEQMLAKKLWQTGGKTPAATIYAAIIREIAVKGSESRFRKTERGKFTLAN